MPERYQEKRRSIPGTHSRGVAIEMLDELADLVGEVLESGCKIKDQSSGDEVTMETINLYHIDEKKGTS